MGDVTLKWNIQQEHDGLTLREYVREIQGISRRTLSSIKHNGGKILVNNIPVTVRHILRTGDYLELYFPNEKRSGGINPENLPLHIAYEDEHLLVINKQPYMATIPSREHPSGSLANALLHYYNEQCLDYTIHVVNRLDRNTSGLLLVAKHRHAHFLFSEQQKQHLIKRRYEAVVHGLIPDDYGVIDKPIGRKSDSIIEREVREDGQRAVTNYRIKERYLDRTWVSITLETGRTHQIRVHMSASGHPLLGDDLYGGKISKIQRQALHSCELSFYHPFLKQEMVFTSELPEDMKALLNEEKRP